ncbi:hypothetical protein ABGB18_14295 [Nonomuraea sp. B12E4]|uniref:GntT/GntP/DsdX family permease n=1 Tax=Nonomuraea sp. B12E4 TaxID=3153564 RepID=UPI00325EC3C4
MSDVGTLANTAVAVVGVVVLIVRLRFNPVVALVAGAGYLGITAGIGVAKTAATIITGFGDIMADIGLLVASRVPAPRPPPSSGPPAAEAPRLSSGSARPVSW